MWGGFINAFAFVMAAGAAVDCGMSGGKAGAVIFTFIAAVNLCCFIALSRERK